MMNDIVNTFPECEELTGRKRQICRGEAGLPLAGRHSVKSYRILWGIDKPPKPTTQTIPKRSNGVNQKVRTSALQTAFNCVHRGSQTREDVSNRCGSRGQQVAIFACAKHGECSLSRYCQHQTVRACNQCGDRLQPQPMRPAKTTLTGVPIDRSKLVSHIIYHVLPLAGSTEWVWRRHVDWLRSVRPEFNGRLIVGIAEKGPTDPWEYVPTADVMAAFDGMDAEFVIEQNHLGSAPRRGKGEGVTFPLMLEKIETLDPNEVFFYGHTKAVTHPGQPLGAPVHLWTEALFEASFRNRAEMVDALDDNGIVGSMRVKKSVKRSRGVHDWHYSGTFWACRSSDVFSRNWRKIKSHYGCVEMWPHGVFKEHESACLFMEAIENSRLLYEPDYWKTTMTPAWEAWKSHRSAAVTIATVLFEPSAAVVANVNRIFADAKSELSAQTIVIDNSPTKTEGVIADVRHWNDGANNFWGGAINQAVSLATGQHFIHFSARRTKVNDIRWMRAIMKPLIDPSCGMAGPVQAVPYKLIGEKNPKPGNREMHIQQSVFAARTDVLRKHPWGAKYPHTYSDVWHSWSLVKAGLKLVDVPEVTSGAGLEPIKPGRMLECGEKLP